MHRKAMIVCIAAVAFATNALAAGGYSRWGVTAAVKAENANSATISPGAGYTQFTTGSADYTVTAADGYDIKTVIVDGRGTNYKNPVNSYTKTFLNDRLLHTLVVVTTPERYDVTTSKTGSGTFSPTRYLKVPYGQQKTPKVVKIVPYRGWQITSVSDNGVPASITDLTGAAVTLPTTKGVKVTYAQMTGNHAIAATFDIQRNVVAKIQPATATEFDVSRGPVAIRLDAFRSTSKVQPLSFVWALEANPVDGATLTADPDYDQTRPQAPVRLFRATKPGTYTVRLTASDGVLTHTESITYNVINLKAGISAPCAHCHSDGSRKSVDQFFGGSIGDDYMASGHAKNPEGAACQDCHQDHSAMIAFPYDSCRNCHAPDKLGGRYAPVANHFAGHSTTFDGMDTQNDCGKCHNPHSATSGQGYTCLACHGGTSFVKAPHFSNISASYMSARASCANCHATLGNIAILKQWAESAHADPKGEAWVHYDFKTRNGCVQCHTTTGFVAFLASGSTAAWGTAGDLTKELLRCDGCHTSPAGTLRTTGAVVKTYNDMSGAPVTYADSGPSNLCISCHSGSQSGAAVAAASNLNQNFAAFNSHYMAAAGVLYGKTGYEYQQTLFPGPHANVGIGNLKDTGTKGPCVTCHMNGKDHKLTAPVTALCASCHADMTEEKLAADKASFDAALKALRLMLEKKGIHYRQTAYPYFYNADLTTQYTTWDSKESLGAAYNFNLLNREAGAFAHNRQYALALVRDSIDWLDNAAIDGSGLSAIDTLVTDGKLTAAERDAARAALAPVIGAGNVEKGDPVLAAAAGYSGSNTCQGCHMAQFTGWSNTLHNKPMKTLAVQGAAALVNDGGYNAIANDVNDFVEGLNFNNTASFSYTNPFAAEAALGNAPILSAENGKYFMQIGTTRYEVVRAQGGNGKWKQRYYTKIGNAYYVLPVQYNEETKQYGAYNKGNWYNGTTPLFSQAYGSQALVDAVADSMVSTAAAAGGATGGAAASSWENRCAGCHQTGLSAQYRTVGTNTKPEVVSGYAELNVGCEACHGPGATHASTMRREDIKNPGRWISLDQNDMYRAQESCGRCHQRGEGKAQFSYSGFGTVKLRVEAPSDLAAGTTDKAVFPIPGQRLLDFMYADLVKKWDTTTNTRVYDGTTTFFPSYVASSGHHQQWEDIEQGKKSITNTTTYMTCFTCHDPHAATPGAIRTKMTVLSADDGLMYTLNTSAEDNTLCFACHSEYNSFSNLSKAEIEAGNVGEMIIAVDTHVKSKYRAIGPPLNIPAKRISAANYLSDRKKDGSQAKYGRIVYKNGQCISCHMPAMASSAVTFLDLQGRKQGDIRSHTFATIWAGGRTVSAGAPAGAPSSCSGCHPAE